MRIPSVLANISILLTFGVAAFLHNYNEPLYYLVVQEDQYLEWASFWGFIVAGGIYLSSAWQQFNANRQLPWFVFGLSLFCFLVAMEEISWGQRLLGYKPPDFFLEENYQQELNLHNVIDTGLRKLVLQMILLGYGVILSAASVWEPIGRLLVRLRIVAPHPALIVSFLAMFVMYIWYPWSHTGEWVELAMACGFAYAALFGRESVQSLMRNTVIVFGSIWILSALTVTVVRYAHAVDPAKLEMTGRELDALAKDFSSGQVRTRCGIHKRLYTFVEQYRQTYLLRGEFSRLLKINGDDARAEFLLDPWNSPYWIRHKCSGGREAKFIYSFGPDRSRDSSDWEIGGQDAGGDDIGVYLER